MNNNEVIIKREFISPERAQQLLEGNGVNRKLQKGVITNYVNQMKKGQWHEDTADTVKISPTGRLLDGQHRLNAIVKNGTGYHFFIAYNVSEDAFSVIDTGKRRNSADTLTIAGVHNATSTGGGITTFLILKQGRSVHGRRKADMGITNEDVMNEYNSRPDFWNHIVTKGCNYYVGFNRTLTPSTIIGWYAMLSDIDYDKADVFMDKLCTGIGFQTRTDPIAQVRAILEKSKSSRHKLTNAYKTAILIKAWNYFFESKEVNLFKYDERTEKYPVLKTTLNQTDEDTADTTNDVSLTEQA